MSIEDYRNKRDFSRTGEPAPETLPSASQNEALRFVIQKHNASHLHYDLRLELGGVLKSWAVPKGPSINPEDKRLSMMVEDHPIEYQYFEGVIPKGNYGAGEVIIWDKGVYSSMETTDRNESEKILNAGLNKGHISFVLFGEKLKGMFDLVRIGKDENTWLLIKRKDEFSSIDDILKMDKSVVSGKSTDDIKNSQQKLDWKSVLLLQNQPNREMPDYIMPMQAHSIKEPFNKKDWLFEIKWDGYRAITHTGDKFKFYSRNHKSFEIIYPELVGELMLFKDNLILDGEIVVLNTMGIPDFQLLQDYLDFKKGILVYYIFDIIYMNGKDLREIPLLQRKNILKQLIINSGERIKYSDHIENDGIELDEMAVNSGLEGVVAKEASSAYKEGVRTNNWLKIKKRFTQEAVICGYTEPRSGRMYFSALILGAYNDENELVYIGHTGGGFSDLELNKIMNLLKPIEVMNCPFRNIPETNGKAHWVKPVYVCEIQFSNWTNDGRMRQPIYLGLRDDKNPDEVKIEQNNKIQNIFKPDTKEQITFEVEGKIIILSNPNKIYWPEENYTKNQLFEYYKNISNYILPYLKERPESLLRSPNGIYGESFFQKNLEDVPRWVKTKPIKSDTENREINCLICNDLATLLFMINLGCIEINPWNSSLKDLDKPDYMIIDLDPEDIDFKFVVKTALETKKILDQFQITSFCKTSGKTGLHICIPMGGKYSYDQVRNFCEIIVRLVHSRIPAFTSIERNPLQRQKKVYLDYLQNRRGQTLSAPYCVRPIRGALVSTPLLWKEVVESLNPEEFNMKSIFSRLDHYGDLWGGVIGEGINLESALKQIEHEIQ